MDDRSTPESKGVLPATSMQIDDERDRQSSVVTTPYTCTTHFNLPPTNRRSNLLPAAVPALGLKRRTCSMSGASLARNFSVPAALHGAAAELAPAAGLPAAAANLASAAAVGQYAAAAAAALPAAAAGLSHAAAAVANSV